MSNRKKRRLWGTAAAAAVMMTASAVISLSPEADASEVGQYVALGDSYSSGTGTRDYYPDDNCGRSPSAFPPQVASRIGATLIFAACGGATVATVPSDQLSRLTAQTKYVTITVGGNDVGFSEIIRQCAKPWPFTCWGDINNASQRARSVLLDQLTELYRQIYTRAPQARIVAISYPRIFSATDCQSLARISVGEQNALNDVANTLAETTARAAGAAGVRYLDSRPAFIGHAICTSAEWVNGLSNPTTESYHPKRSGHAGFAAIVEPALTAP